jgi:hypothetical protein
VLFPVESTNNRRLAALLRGIAAFPLFWNQRLLTADSDRPSGFPDTFEIPARTQRTPFESYAHFLCDCASASDRLCQRIFTVIQQCEEKGERIRDHPELFDDYDEFSVAGPQDGVANT